MEEYGAAIGLRHTNDKSMPITIAVGARPRLAVRQSVLFRRNDHGTQAHLEARPRRRDGPSHYRYMQRFRKLQDDIQIQKDTEIEERKAKTLIYDIFRNKIVPLGLFPFVVQSYEMATKEQKGTGRILHNAVSERIKRLAPAPTFRATARLGKFMASKF